MSALIAAILALLVSSPLSDTEVPPPPLASASAVSACSDSSGSEEPRISNGF